MTPSVAAPSDTNPSDATADREFGGRSILEAEAFGKCKPYISVRVENNLLYISTRSDSKNN